MRDSKMPLLSALGLALCCGVPVLLASGALTALIGALVWYWPLTLLGGGIVAYGAFKVAVRVRRPSAGNEQRYETRRVP
ncbi:MAG: hypothetical protein ACRDJM_07735 [Actinomycetota bacterium]